MAAKGLKRIWLILLIPCFEVDFFRSPDCKKKLDDNMGRKKAGERRQENYTKEDIWEWWMTMKRRRIRGTACSGFTLIRLQYVCFPLAVVRGKLSFHSRPEKHGKTWKNIQNSSNFTLKPSWTAGCEGLFFPLQFWDPIISVNPSLASLSRKLL